MKFDFTLLNIRHGTYLLSALAALTLLIITRKKRTGYIGLALIAVTVALSGLFLNYHALIGLLGGAFFLAIGGIRDERHRLAPAQQLLWQLAAVITAVSFGWTIPYITHPFVKEGVVYLNWYTFGPLIFPGSLLAILWLLLLINAMNWLDGTDGVAGSISLVTFFTLAAVSLLPATQDATTLALSLVGIGGSLAFLVWNWPPAKVYLGTTGVWFLGLYLGLTAMIGGGKIATTALVLTLPLSDAMFVIIDRIRHGQRPWQGGDQRHLHDRLRRSGLSAQAIVWSAIIYTAILSCSALLLPTSQKLLSIVVAVLILGTLIATVQRYAENKK